MRTPPRQPWRSLVARGLVAALGVLAGCGSEPVEERPSAQDVLARGAPNFLVIDIDSMRADRVEAERGWRKVAPNIAALAERGVRFDGMHSQSGWTLPSITTFLTGAWPRLVGSTSGTTPGFSPYIQPGNMTLAEVLGVNGYHTRVYWGATTPASFEELSRGFDTVEVFAGEEREANASSAEQLPYGRAVREWLESGPQEPFFAFVHELDLHWPKPSLPDEVIHEYTSSARACRGLQLNRATDALQGQLDSSRIEEHMVGHYDAALHYYDGVVGQLLATLEETGLDERTVVMLMSDHGEMLFERGQIDHVGPPFEQLLQVPLIFADPALADHPIRSSTVVQTIDLAPTILARAGLVLAASMTGQSLLPLAWGDQDPRYEQRPVYVLSGSQGGAVLSAGEKLILVRPEMRKDRPPPSCGDTSANYLYFDLLADPEEQNNLCGERPERAHDLRRSYRLWASRLVSDPTIKPPAPSQELLDQMSDLGYWEAQSGPGGKKR